MRRCHLRGRENILKRQWVHVGALNLSLILRKLLGAGTPRELNNRAGQVFSRLLRSLLNLTTVDSLIWRFTRPAGLRIAPSSSLAHSESFRHGLLSMWRASENGKSLRNRKYAGGAPFQPSTESGWPILCVLCKGWAFDAHCEVEAKQWSEFSSPPSAID
jgi:hypothetical protein